MQIQQEILLAERIVSQIIQCIQLISIISKEVRVIPTVSLSSIFQQFRRSRLRLKKQLSNTDKEKYADVEFKFQLLVQNDDRKYVPSSTAGILSDGSEVKFKSETINDVSYANVFTLKPGQHATFSGLEENKNYRVQELDVSDDKYDQVLINGEKATNKKGNVISSEATVDSRPWVTVTNVLASVAELDFKKVNTKGEALSGAGLLLLLRMTILKLIQQSQVTMES